MCNFVTQPFFYLFILFKSKENKSKIMHSVGMEPTTLPTGSPQTNYLLPIHF